MSYPRPLDVVIAVVGGAGTTPKPFFGEIVKSFMDAPAGAHYDHRVNTAAGKPAHIADNLVDDVFDENAYPVQETMSFVVQNATIDGTYTLTVWYRQR